jgi:hypothetical protein
MLEGHLTAPRFGHFPGLARTRDELTGFRDSNVKPTCPGLATLLVTILGSFRNTMTAWWSLFDPNGTVASHAQGGIAVLSFNPLFVRVELRFRSYAPTADGLVSPSSIRKSGCAHLDRP